MIMYEPRCLLAVWAVIVGCCLRKGRKGVQNACGDSASLHEAVCKDCAYAILPRACPCITDLANHRLAALAYLAIVLAILCSAKHSKRLRGHANLHVIRSPTRDLAR